MCSVSCTVLGRTRMAIKPGMTYHFGFQCECLSLLPLSDILSKHSFVEMTAGIVVCCMPTTAAVLRRLADSKIFLISPLGKRKPRSSNQPSPESSSKLRPNLGDRGHWTQLLAAEEPLALPSMPSNDSADVLDDLFNPEVSSVYRLKSIRKMADIEIA